VWAINSRFTGVFPALPVPFRADYSIDEPALAALADWLIGFEGIAGLVVNGIAGEVFALSFQERVEVARIVAESAGDRVPVISGLYCERLEDVTRQAESFQSVGAGGLLVMPPGRWLRYGMRPDHVVDHFQAAAEGSTLPQVAHLYPSWTKAAYTPETLSMLAELPRVTTFKVGTREMAQTESNIRAIRAADDEVTILTCQDEYLLASMVGDVDGAMVGFASFVPELVTALYNAVRHDDLSGARQIYEDMYPLNRLVYGSDHPTYENYPRMKTAMKLAGRLTSDVVRPPIQSSDRATVDHIHAVLRESGMVRTV
jgi:4-hydroxy-tetrahydrodipicolinate synthase